MLFYSVRVARKLEISMATFVFTLTLAFGILVIALLGMGIGYFFKKKCLKKQCDVNPDSCSCKRAKKCEDKDRNDHC